MHLFLERGVNSEEYLRELSLSITEVFQPNDVSGSMTAALLAHQIRQRIGVSHKDGGFSKFKDALIELEGCGLIKTGANSKQAYAVWLTGRSAPIDSTGLSVTPDSNRPKRHRSLRSPLWHAFVSVLPTGRRFFHRTLGDIRSGLKTSPGEDWVEIIPVSDDEERSEAKEFLELQGLVANREAVDSLESVRWYSLFPEILSKSSPDLAVEWKRSRSDRIIAKVEDWCKVHHLDEEIVFMPQLQPAFHGGACQRSDLLRDSLLNALAKMTTDRLLELNIPTRLLVEVLRPDLLRE